MVLDQRSYRASVIETDTSHAFLEVDLVGSSSCWLHWRNIVNKRGRGTLLHTVLGVVVEIAGEWLLGGPRQPPKAQRAGASIRLDERHDEAVSNYKRTPPPSSDAAWRLIHSILGSMKPSPRGRHGEM